MITSDEIFMITGMAAVTFGIRYFMFVISKHFEFPQLFEKSLGYVPPAVLSAIIVPSILMPNGESLQINPLNNPYIIGAVSACIAGWLYKKLLLTIVVGMTVFLCSQWLMLHFITI